MKRQKLHHVIPSLIMAGAVAVPVVTVVEILTHLPGDGQALSPAGPMTALPSRSPLGAIGASGTGSGGVRTYQGPAVNDPYGSVQATVTIAGKTISDVSITAPQDNPRSASINQQAVPLLRRETLQAQSAQLSAVSGATYTSQAYAQSLQAALDQARKQGNGPAGSGVLSRSGGLASVAAGHASSVSESEGDDSEGDDPRG